MREYDNYSLRPRFLSFHLRHLRLVLASVGPSASGATTVRSSDPVRSSRLLLHASEGTRPAAMLVLAQQNVQSLA